MARQPLPTDEAAEQLSPRQLAVKKMWERRRAEGLAPPEGAYPRLKNHRRHVAYAEAKRFADPGQPKAGTPNTPIKPRGRAKTRAESHELSAELAGLLQVAERRHVAALPAALQPLTLDLMAGLRAALLRPSAQGQPS